MKKTHALFVLATFALTALVAASTASVSAETNSNDIVVNRRNRDSFFTNFIHRVCDRLTEQIVFLNWCLANDNTNDNQNTNENSNSNTPTNGNENMNQNSNTNEPSNDNQNSNTNEPGNGNSNSNNNSNSNTNTNTPPDQTSSGVMISEVFQTSPNNAEWVEIYNGSGIAIDFTGWMIGDSTTTEILLPTGLVPSNGFLLIVATSTPSFLEPLPANVVKVFKDTTITASGINSDNDSIVLKNSTGDMVDGMSFGNNHSVFNPAVGQAPTGLSYFRTDLTTDTDTATDWNHHVPNPGIAP